ncbi:peroxisome proliferator-activated receptor gamma coactivator 1-alpha-like [Daphnia pulicaria]|uniref:peroxisome proliferator-activated receptor gamma coactivator 1-alpha-like n=1 Tax=Daphnia pulicaria TaxID=35523 RepID=UPI001EEC26F8|nr:peroxisome proliferator-activated receptor gamma coactivator 1-alpha-like [Daphnia pulicaria]XP_046648284.1 peroxisome proliferator-activated receptor gamma coactivator 1-alpha-like [Daphnia pulicaria]
MEEAVCINDYDQGCASGGNGDFQTDQLNNMDLNLDRFDSSFLELDEEDLSEIHRMVDEWELNFGALESSDGEELVRLIQIDNPSQLGWSHYPGAVGSSHSNNSNADWSNSIDWSSNVDELHDRLPSYYTALASSRSAPWMPPASQLVFNKLPAYITDMAPLDAATTSDSACGSVGQPGKKKLNLAEYRTRREKQLQQMQEEEEQQQQQQQQIKQEQEEQDQQILQQQEANEQKDEKIRVKADQIDKQQCYVKPHQAKESALVKDEPEEGEVEEEEVKEKHKKQQQPEVASVKSRRIRSSRSPTRSYSSQSSSSRRCRSSSASSYSSRSRSRSPSHRRGRRRRRSSSNSSSSSSSWNRKIRHTSSRRRTGRRRRTPTPPPRLSSSRGGYGDRSHRERRQQHQQQSERQRQIEERRVIYVGKLADGTTRSDLRQRFEPFGPVVDISLHFRERGDNYGFVTFSYKVDAYEAVEHGNDDPHLPKYDLSFGGRRAFCKETYADLDAVDDDGRSKANDVDFETLLRAVKVQLTRRPCS